MFNGEKKADIIVLNGKKADIVLNEKKADDIKAFNGKQNSRRQRCCVLNGRSKCVVVCSMIKVEDTVVCQCMVP